LNKNKIITVNDLNSDIFYKLPKAFFLNPFYTSMKNESKLAYALLKDQLSLSAKNGWINEDNEIYVKLSREKLMKYLNIKGTQKMTQIMDELKSKNLIVEKQLGVNRCNEIYMCSPDELDTIYSDDELLENGNESSASTENTLTFENQNSGLLKNKGQDFLKSKVKTFENQIHNKNNYNKTNYNNNKSAGEKKLKFDNFEARKYDYDALEKKLLGWDKD